jgi:hypothetical protein
VFCRLSRDESVLGLVQYFLAVGAANLLKLVGHAVLLLQEMNRVRSCWCCPSLLVDACASLIALRLCAKVGIAALTSLDPQPRLAGSPRAPACNLSESRQIVVEIR